MSGTFAAVEKKVIGQGSCVAYKTYSKSHGMLVYKHFERELWALRKLDITTREKSTENHIVCLLDNQETVTCYHLIFPFYNQTIQSFIDNNKKMPDIAQDFLKQVSKGLLYMHQHDIIHCDISPSNILIDDTSGCMYICDFGCAHSYSDASSTHNDRHVVEEIGTRLYKAPEHLFGSKKYAPSTDVWSMSVIFLQLLIGYPIFAGESDIEQMGRIVFRLGKPSARVQLEEMAEYPDANKLSFFSSDSDDESIEFSDSDEEEAMFIIRKPLEEVLVEEQIPDSYQALIMNTLTWSVKDRYTIPEIISLLDRP